MFTIKRAEVMMTANTKGLMSRKLSGKKSLLTERVHFIPNQKKKKKKGTEW